MAQLLNPINDIQARNNVLEVSKRTARFSGVHPVKPIGKDGLHFVKLLGGRLNEVDLLANVHRKIKQILTADRFYILPAADT